MKTTFEEFARAMEWYWDENESVELEWQADWSETCWRAKLTTKDNVITTTFIKHLEKYNIGIQIINNEIFLYH